MAAQLRIRKRSRPVRKSVTDLTDDEIADLRSAFAQAQALSDNRGYAYLAGIPGLPQPMHRPLDHDLFLPWHRKLLIQFESALQDLVPDVTVPFWDWTASGSEGIPALFAADTVDGSPNPLHEALISPAALEQAGETGPRATLREPGRAEAPTLPSAADVAGALSFSDFRSFSQRLENLSNMVHVWVGGDMSSVALGAFDPLYWAHRAMVDQLWALWQERHPNAEFPEERQKDALEPFGVTVKDVLDPEKLPYRYGPAGEYAAPVLLQSGAVNDQPAEGDALGFKPYAAAFAEMIAAPTTKPPLTVGIFASWGMGKSTLLDGIVSEIETGQGHAPPEKSTDESETESRFIHVVRFNAWDYSAEEAIWPALVRETMSEIQRQVPWSKGQRLWERFRHNLSREWGKHAARIVASLVLVAASAVIAIVNLKFDATAVGIAALGLGAAGLLKVLTDAFSNPATKWVGDILDGASYGERIGYMDQIRDDLEFLVRQLQAHTDVERRVLVVVDDLDRCEPDKIVEVLQAINRLLNFPCFIVCLGMDARLVVAAVEMHYKNLLGEAGASGFEYLDKIVQIPFRIPEPDADAMADYVHTLLPTQAVAAAESGVAPESSPEQAVIAEETEAADISPAETEYVAREESLADEAALGQRVPFREEEVQAFRAIVPHIRSNPRHVKRLINVYRLVRTVAEWRSRTPEDAEAANLVLSNPYSTIRWIVAAAQWPYTTSAMLAECKAMEASGELDRVADQDPLECLLKRAKLTPETRDKFDDESELLQKLIAGPRMTWPELRAIRDYTVNFNPAVQEQLRLEARRREAEAASPLPATATGRAASGKPQQLANQPKRLFMKRP